MTTALEIIEKKRDGQPLSPEEIAFFVTGYTRGEIPDYQAAAWLMAAYLRPLSNDETVALTRSMLDSGDRADLADLDGAKIGKHSTGGVGDTVSLIAAPLCAACGVWVPKMSGRGLGHTGGTLDKLESIPGLSVDFDLAGYRRLIREAGWCIVGQSDRLAPADMVFYALRDVTGTVASAPLIAASIMSKKLAEGTDGMVLDVTTGRGAFMGDVEKARELAQCMVDIGRAMGKSMTALITPMDQPLGHCVGNALEIVEAVTILKKESGPLSADKVEVCLAVAAHMVLLGHGAADLAEAEARVRKALDSGQGYEAFCRMVAAQGGDVAAVDDVSRLSAAKNRHMLRADRDGVLVSCDALAVGKGCVLLGAGRQRKGDPIDPGCGVVLHAKVGDEVARGDVVMEIACDDAGRLERALPLLEGACVVGHAVEGEGVPRAAVLDVI